MQIRKKGGGAGKMLLKISKGGGSKKQLKT
jgi:hypothetical protein